MTNPCTPPPGTADGTWHWLNISSANSDRFYWTRGMWRPFRSDFTYTTARMAEKGWRYRGPIEAMNRPLLQTAALAVTERLERIGLLKPGSADWFRMNGGITRQQVAACRADAFRDSFTKQATP